MFTHTEMSPFGTIIASQSMEETVVDSSAPGSFSIISLSSASPANSELNISPILPPPPMNTPTKFLAKNQTASPVSNTASIDQLLSCFYPLNRLWPFNWSGTEREIFSSSDSETDNYEILLESIEVNFKENYIGGGNQSSVFRGKWKGQWIALKKLNRASEVDIRRLCSLNHPNVIKTLGVCTKDIYPCIVMEYCEKGGLFDCLRHMPVISKSLFMRWSVEVATGMAYLHSLKIAHRDLKSPNILVDNQDTLKICDFGSLYSWDQRINSQNQAPTQMASVVMSVCGTSQWMSPEMMKNEPCNEKVDVWSYGVVLWELLTGEVPYEKIAPMAVCFGVGSDRLRLHVPKTAPESIKFLLKLCWAKKPRNRPSFVSILGYLNNLQAELAEMQESGWTMRRELWRREIAEENAKLVMHNSGKGQADLNAQKQREEELVQKRMHELRHAQEIRQLYDMKLVKVDRIMRRINRLMQQMKIQKGENERVLTKLNDRLAHNNHWHQLLKEWHAELKEMKDDKRRGFMNIAELKHLMMQAEEARKTAMFLNENGEHQGDDEELYGEAEEEEKIEYQQIGNGNRREETQIGHVDRRKKQQNTRRSAILQMTYYDDPEEDNTLAQMVKEQKVRIVQQQQRQQKSPHPQMKMTKGCRNFDQRKISDKGNGDKVVKCHDGEINGNFCQRRRNSSTSSSGEDDGQQRYSTPIEKMKKQPKKHRLQQNAINNNTGLMGQQQPHRQYSMSLMSSSPSEGSSLTNVPSNYSVISRSSSYHRSADLNSPGISTQQTITPKFIGTSLSRDDSAISSTIPFSPSSNSTILNNNMPSSASFPHEHLPLCNSCHCNLALQFFARNSVARASGLSADSGLCQEEELIPTIQPPFINNIFEKNGNLVTPGEYQNICCLAPNTCQCPFKTIQKGQFLNYETGTKSKDDYRKKSRRRASHFNRDSPLRILSRRAGSSISLFKESQSTRGLEKRMTTKCNWQGIVMDKNHHKSVTEMEQPEDVIIFHDRSHSGHCSTLSSNTLGRNSNSESKESNTTRHRLSELGQQSSQEWPSHWFSSPELCQIVDDDSEESPRKEAKMLDKKQLCPIDEMTDSQLTERALAAENKTEKITTATVMLDSSSTMISSLERSLEMAVQHSDGLSDREVRLKEAKTTFKLTHRRTSSNPTKLPLALQQQKPKFIPDVPNLCSTNNDIKQQECHNFHTEKGGKDKNGLESDSDEVSS